MKSRRGFALIAALWLVVAIATVAMEFALEAHARQQLAFNVVEGAQASAIAEGGLELAQSRLTAILRQTAMRNTGQNADRLRSSDPWSDIDTMLVGTDTVAGAAIEVSVRDVGSAMNINTVTEIDLRNFFRSLQIDLSTADRLAQAIMDWRDADDLSRPSGAERQQYIDDRKLSLPRNGPFLYVSELLDVDGMTQDLFEQISPFVIAQGSGRVNLNSAPEAVLYSLPGMNAQMIATIMSLRSSGQRVRSVAELAQGSGAGTRLVAPSAVDSPSPSEDESAANETLAAADATLAVVSEDDAPYAGDDDDVQGRGGGGGGGGGQAGGRGGGAAGGQRGGGRGDQGRGGRGDQGRGGRGDQGRGGRGAPPGGGGRGGPGGGQQGQQSPIVQALTNRTTVNVEELEITITGWNVGHTTSSRLTAIVTRQTQATTNASTTVTWKRVQ